MSRKGNPHDNASRAPSYKAIKKELVNNANFADIDQAQQEIVKCIRTYYITKRRHPALVHHSSKKFDKEKSQNPFA